jgi:hypothetical protein
MMKYSLEETLQKNVKENCNQDNEQWTQIRAQELKNNQ